MIFTESVEFAESCHSIDHAIFGSKVLLQDPEGISIVQNNFIIKQSYGNLISNKSLLSLTSSPSISSTPRFMELESTVTACSEQR